MEEIYSPKQNPNNTHFPSVIDFEKYLLNYSGNTRFNRLLHWIQQDFYLAESHNLLVVEFLRSSNTTLFRKLIEDKILTSNGSLAKSTDQTTHIIPGGNNNNNPFEEWFSSTEKTLQTTLNILENELLTAKSTTVKESIRIAYCELGHLYYKWGKLDDAFKSFLRSRDYCSMPKHHSDVAFELVLLSFDMKQYYNANNFVNKLIDLSTDSAMIGKGKIIQGLLLLLNEGNFAYAASKFLEVSSLTADITNEDLQSITSLYDIGFYTFVLCLATMSYSELKAKLIQNKGFINHFIATSSPSPPNLSSSSCSSANAVEVTSTGAPAAAQGPYNPYAFLKLKQILSDVMNNSFQSLFTALPTIYTLLTMDLYFKHHASYLMRAIIEKMFLQFLAPYQTLSLEQISLTFPQLTSIKMVKDLLIGLISSSKLSAKIDSTNNLLKKNSVHLEKKVIDATHGLIAKNTVMLSRGLLRTSLQRHGFVIDVEAEQGGGGKSKRLQDVHGRPSKRGGGGGRGRRGDGAGGGGAAVQMIDEGDDVSDREDDLDEETLMMIAQSEEQVHRGGGGGGDDYYSGDEDI